MNNIKAGFFRKAVFVPILILATVIQTQAQIKDSLDIKIGQMILIGFAGTVVDSAVLHEIKEGKAGTVIIFEKNIPPKNSFITLKKIIWTYQQAASIPLLVGIDQEGGKVNRLKDKYGFPKSITAAEMGKASTLDSVKFYAEATASTLAGLGININFAPVVDLASNPNNPIIAKHGRAFSSKEDTVILMSKEFIKQHRKYGVLTSLKHFPGHGSSKADTHLGIADVTNTWEERELKPYQALIDSGYVDAIMTSHIVNMKLDSAGNPGTLSAPIITGILRNKLNYQGVVFSDDMQMHAITKHFGFEEAVKKAINAGVDIMTFSNNISGSDLRTVDKVHEIIKQMVASGEIKQSRIDESYRRIISLKKRLVIDSESLQAEIDKAAIENRMLKDTLKKKEEEIVALQTPPTKKKTKKKRK
jgi:beta-N-acetylhexosaminidase